MKKSEFAELVKKCEETNNFVDFEGMRYYIEDDAYPDNDRWGDLVYKANAYNGEFEDEDFQEEDDNLKCYKITWKTTDTWNEYTEKHNEYVKETGDNNSDWLGYLEDASNACDWDNPVSVEEC